MIAAAFALVNVIVATLSVLTSTLAGVNALATVGAATAITVRSAEAAAASPSVETVDVAVPEGIVEAEVHQHLEGENRLDDDEHRAEVQESTRRALKAQFLLDALSEKLEIEVEQPELIEYLIMSAQQYGMDPNQFAQAIDSQGQIGSMVAEVARRKALASVLENAVVKDASGNVVDLNEAVPGQDDEVADDAAEVVEIAEASDEAEDAKA